MLPPEPVLRSILQTYFQHCHNQPYAYFRPDYFFWRLNCGDLPGYLLMTIIALTARFSNDSYFKGRQLEIVESFTRAAWNEIFQRSFSDDDALGIHQVQATNMLAIMDFTGMGTWLVFRCGE